MWSKWDIYQNLQLNILITVMWSNVIPISSTIPANYSLKAKGKEIEEKNITHFWPYKTILIYHPNLYVYAWLHGNFKWCEKSYHIYDYTSLVSKKYIHTENTVKRNSFLSIFYRLFSLIFWALYSIFFSLNIQSACWCV